MTHLLSPDNPAEEEPSADLFCRYPAFCGLPPEVLLKAAAQLAL
jgi:hypothetical protein